MRPTDDPARRGVVVQVEEEDRVERPADRVEHLVESLGLHEVPWEPVEHEAARRIVPRESVANQGDRQLVRDELARGEDRLDLPTELRPVHDRSAKHVAGRDVRDTVGCAEPLCLGALPGSLRPEHEDVDGRYLRKPS